jgi:hypothetical protein
MSVDQQTVEVMSLTKELTGDALTSWSDAKRKEFVDTFGKRTRVAQYILVSTARLVWNKAYERQFVSNKHQGALENSKIQEKEGLYDSVVSGSYRYSGSNYSYLVGDRDVKELDAIARERAEAILESLPPLKKAVEYISPEISKLIEKRDGLIEKGKELFEQTKDLSGALDMDDFPGTMTLAEFQAAAKERDKKRRGLCAKMDDVGKEGLTLDKQINKFLYAGLPGLSDAVVDVVNSLYEKALSFSALHRRVTEQVQFGDSEAALQILSSFEKDEVTVSDNIKAQFDRAVEALKNAARKQRPKTLKGK